MFQIVIIKETRFIFLNQDQNMYVSLKCDAFQSHNHIISHSMLQDKEIC